jgi:hypothetical protein
MKERIFIADGNGYMHRAFATLNSHRPTAVAFPFHLASMICKDATAVKAKHLLVAFDGPDNFRYGVYDGYKSARREKQGIVGGGPASSTTGIYSYLGAIKNYFLHAGIPYYMPEQFYAQSLPSTTRSTISFAAPATRMLVSSCAREFACMTRGIRMQTRSRTLSTSHMRMSTRGLVATVFWITRPLLVTELTLFQASWGQKKHKRSSLHIAV